MKKTGKKLLAIATAVSLAALALSGCGGGSAAPSSAAQPSETKKEEAQKQAEAAGAESSAGDADYTQGDPIVIKIAHVSQEGVPIDLASNKLGEMLKEKTGGRITVDVFPASALGNNTELLEQLQMGTLEMAISSVAFLGAFTDSTALLDLPYLFQSNEAAEEVLDGEVGQEIFSNLEPAGFKGMTWMATGWRQLTANKEIHKPEDMKGLKIRVMENQMHIDHFNALGASAVPMAFSELYTALQNGTMDAQENPFEVIYANRLYEQQDYVILTNHLPASHNLLISQVVYNGLSDTDKELIMAVGKAAIQYSREQCDARLSERMDLVAQTGTEIVELPADVLEQLRDKCSGVYDEVRATYGDELVDMQISTAEKYA